MRIAIASRVLATMLTLLGVGTAMFFLIRLIPGDAVDLMFVDAERIDPDATAGLRALFGLDRPLHEQFGSWFGSVLRGDLGVSIRTRRPVVAEIVDRIPATVELALGAVLIAVLIAVPAGVVSATRRNSASDLAARLTALLGLSLPNFFLGLLLIYAFAVIARVLPAGGYVPITQAPLENLRFAVLPTITLGTALAAITMRLTRSSLLEVLSNDYIRTARAKGLRERVLVYRHALRNALIPVVTVLGLQVGRLLGGTVIVEQVFSWPGLGQLLIQAINTRDYPLVQGSVLFLAIFFIIANLIVDALYLYLDPRLRHG